MAGGAPPGAAEPAAAEAWLRDFSMLCEFTRGRRYQRWQRHNVRAGYYALPSFRGLPLCIRDRSDRKPHLFEVDCELGDGTLEIRVIHV
jgi:hypothetical protein